MIKINIFLEHKNMLIDIDSLPNDFKLKDSDYIDGAINLAVDESPIFLHSDIDYIDQLVAYIINDFHDLVFKGKESFSFYYPDQAIKVSFERNRNDIVISVGGREAVANIEKFWRAFSVKAILLFNKLKKLDNQLLGSSDFYLGLIQDISSRVTA